jgi:hypothetical protein
MRLDRATRRALTAAAAKGDAAAFRSGLAPVLREQPDLVLAWRADPAIAAGLEALDGAVYGRDPATSLDLPDLARRLARPAPGITRPVMDHGRLASLDGPP